MPLEQGSHRVGLYTVVVLAGVIVIIAGLRAAAGLLVPFLLAGFFGIICSSPLFLMKRKGVPIWLALPIVIIGILMLFGFLGMLLTYSVDQFTSNIEKYNELLRKVVRDLVEWLEIHGIYSRWSTNFDPLNGGNSVSFFTNALQSVAETLSNVLLIILTTAFILLEAAGFERKLQDAFDKPGSHFQRLENFLTGVRRYLGIKTITSLCTGILATFWLWILGVDFAILWGLLAFLLNFIPNIGSFIAGIPPTLLAFLQFGWFEAGLVVLGYFVINTAIGGIIEPRVM
ncbi:MAG: AI-2E family transporter, partial [Phycisphaerae bacterium]